MISNLECFSLITIFNSKLLNVKKIDRLSYEVLNIAAPCNNNTNLPSNQTGVHSIFEWRKDILTLEFVLHDS